MSDEKNKTFKPGWRQVRFGEVVRQCKEKADPETSGLERYVAGDHMDTDDLRLRRWGEIGSGYLGPAFHIRFKPGHVLYGSRRTYLRKVAVADFEGICANTTFVMEPQNPEKLLPDFLPYLMQTDAFNAFSIQNSKGSVNPYINFSDLERFEFPLPPPEEQAKITYLLSSADAVRHELEFAEMNLGQTERAAIQAVLGKESGWQLTTMKAVVAHIDAGKSPKASSLPAEPHEFGVLKVSAIGHHGYCSEENKALLDEKDFVEDATVRTGDFLVTRANAQPQGVARTCVVESTPDNLMLSDKTWRLHFCPGAPTKRFMLAWTKLPMFRSYIETLCSGTEAKNISQEKFLAAPMVELSEQQSAEIDEVLRQTDSTRKALHERLRVCISIKRALLTRALGDIAE